MPPRQLHSLTLNAWLFNGIENNPPRVETHHSMQTAPASNLHMQKSPNEDQWRITFFGRFQPQLHRHNDATPVIRIVVYRPLTRSSHASHLPHRIPSNYPIANQTLNLYTPHTSPNPTTKMPVPMPSATSQSNSATQSSAAAQARNDIQNAATRALANANNGEKTEQEKEAEKRYEEAMEEEYAKREGGA